MKKMGSQKKWDNRITMMKRVKSLLYLQKSFKAALADLTEEDFDGIIAGLDFEIQKAETGKLRVIRIEELK